MSRLEEIEARLHAAAKGPWHLAGGNEWIYPIGIAIAPDDGGVSVPVGDFIAHAPEDIAYLLAELEKAQTRQATANAGAHDFKEQG